LFVYEITALSTAGALPHASGIQRGLGDQYTSELPRTLHVTVEFPTSWYPSSQSKVTFRPSDETFLMKPFRGGLRPAHLTGWQVGCDNSHVADVPVAVQLRTALADGVRTKASLHVYMAVDG